MGTHPIFESDFDCLTDRFVDFSNRIKMSASGPNIQLELRLAEMARMNEEIRRRHLEVEADKRRAQRTGGMVTRDQSITMATAMPTDFDATREDGFKDGLDSRPLPADPYGKDRVPRDKRGKPQDKMTSKNSKKKQTIDEARQRGMADQEFWRQEQARADAARIKRAQGRDGTWRREWDREKNHTDERDSFSRSRGGGDKSRDKFRRGDGRGDQMSRRHDSGGGPPSGGRYGGGRGGGGGRHQDSHGMSRDGGGGGGRMNRKEFRNDREPRNRRGSGDDYHRFGGGSQQRGMNSRYSRPNNRKLNNPDPVERESSESELDLKPPSRDVEIKSEDSLREYSSDEGPSRRRRQEGSRNEDEPEDEDEQEIELPPSIESSRESSSSSQEDNYEEKDEIDTEILEALQAQEKAEALDQKENEESVDVEESVEEKKESIEAEKAKTEADNEVLSVTEDKPEAKEEIEKNETEDKKTEEVKEESTNEDKIEKDEKTPPTKLEEEGVKLEEKDEEVLQKDKEAENEHSST